MSRMNPYAKYIGNRKPMDVIADTPRALQQAAQQIGPQRLNQPPAPGKWSAREILCHLADCEMVFGFRYRQTAAEDHHVIQPFDQDKWASAYAAYDADSALKVFSALRAWNLAFLKNASPALHAKKLTHPERGEMTFETIIETMAGHDLNHIAQLEAIAKKSA
jgi:uncharacterized damage-inducible protein DinB